MYVFGIDLPLLELLVILSMIVVVYLLILEFEFRQFRRIVKKMDEEELIFSREVRELRKDIGDMRNICTTAGIIKPKKKSPPPKSSSSEKK